MKPGADLPERGTLPSSTRLSAGVRQTRLALVLGLGYLLFATFSPFFSALVWSAALSYGLYPLYVRLVQATGGRHTLSAVIMSLGVTLGLILPLAYMSIIIGKEVARTYITIVAMIEQGPTLFEQWRGHPWILMVIDQLQEFQRVTGTDLRAVLVENLAQLGRALVEQLTHVARNVLSGLTELTMILLCTFYFFRDGNIVATWITQLLPFVEARKRLVIRRFDEVVKATVFGNTLVAAVEGMIGGIAFALVGLPTPLLWGAAMALLAYLPLVGAAVVWGPAALYLFLQDRYGAALFLCIAGVLIALTDYIVRTIVVGEASKLHTLLAFFAMLGGIQFFGLVGIVAGPLVVAISVALLESYRAEQLDLLVSTKDA